MTGSTPQPTHSTEPPRSTAVFTIGTAVDAAPPVPPRAPSADEHSSTATAADFETAVAATGYGRFNLALMLIAWPCCMSSVYESACISYIIPIAECDLRLSLADKGVLNAIAYAGMITSAIPWGYYADRFGRRQLLIYGLFADGACMFASSLSRNVHALMFFKYLGGAIMCGPFAVLMSYISEFHGTRYRPSVMMIIGMFFSLATVSLPAIGWLILPITWTLDVGGVLSLSSWQMFLTVCAVPSVIGALGLLFMPESPRFLMSNGRNAEALVVLRTIYAWNTGRPQSDYPIRQLVDERPVEAVVVVPVNNESSERAKEKLPRKVGVGASMSAGLAPILPLLRKPLLGKLLLVLTIQFCTLLGLNTMRLWLPQLYTIVTDAASWQSDAFTASAHSPDLCGMIAYSVNQSQANLQSVDWLLNCTTPQINSAMYMNTIYSGFTGLFGYVVAGVLIRALGTKRVIVGGLAVVGACGWAMVWATSAAWTVALSSVYVSLGSICTTAFIGVIVNVFPTSLRTLTISVSMMCGRMGALIGNVVFPYLLALGCVAPFTMVGTIMLVSSCLCMALPKSNTVALK